MSFNYNLQDDNLPQYNKRCYKHDSIIVDTNTSLNSSNPKDILGIKKPPLDLVPPGSIVEEAMAFAEGAQKYGSYNWREKKVKKTIYIAAALRHLLALLDGEDLDPDSNLPHEAKVKACMSILIDARQTGNLIDDRPKAGKTNEVIKGYTKK